MLHSNSTTLSYFNLLLPIGVLINDLNNRLLREELNYNVDELKEENLNLVQNLNSEQQYIYI